MPVVQRIGQYRAGWRIDGGIVDQHIDAAQFRGNAGNNLTIAIKVRHIKLIGVGCSTGMGDFVCHGMDSPGVAHDMHGHLCISLYNPNTVYRLSQEGT